MKKRKLLQKALSSPKNIHFDEMVALAEAFGFRLSRVKGSHHIFVHPQVRELVNFKMWVERPSRTRFVSS
jgi:hypothetical protein